MATVYIIGIFRFRVPLSWVINQGTARAGNVRFITLGTFVQIMTSSRVISFRQVRDVPNEHDFVDLLRHVGIFRLQMLHHLVR
jgi:hypothetical protein